MRISHYLLLVKRLGLLMAVYFTCRILFFAFNADRFEQASLVETVAAFALGIRYDLSTIFSINIVFVLLSLLPFGFTEKQGYQKFLKIFFLLSNLPFIVLNLVDVEFFKFTGRRTSFEIVRIAADVSDQLPQLVFNYWHLSLISLLLVAGMAYFYPSFRESKGKLSLLPAIGALLVSIGLSILMIRNSVELKPLLPRNAFALTPYVMGNVALNTPFVFFKTVDAVPLQRVSYFEHTKDYLPLIAGKHETPSCVFKSVAHTPPVEAPATAVGQGQNVVIIILESFGSEYLATGNNHIGYTPFLDSLAKQGVFFKNNFANGRRSIEAVPSILAGIPNLMEEAFISSPFQTNKVYGLGTALRENGYHTSFFHGGKNGTMGFDYFAKAAGFSDYYGLNEYPNSDDFDGHWGIPDEPFLGFFASKLSRTPQPFASAVFTLSSHQPYTIPAKYKGQFPKGTLEIHESLGYADMSLQKFFEAAQKTNWYSNTLFILTADHTQMSEHREYDNETGCYDVPLLLFHPKGRLPAADTTKITQHCDVMASVLDYTGITPKERLYFGNSVFGKGKGVAINYNNGHYVLIHDDYFLTFSNEKGSTLYDFNTKQEVSPLSPAQLSLKQQYEKQVKAYIQYYNNGLIDNNWYDQ